MRVLVPHRLLGDVFALLIGVSGAAVVATITMPLNPEAPSSARKAANLALPRDGGPGVDGIDELCERANSRVDSAASVTVLDYGAVQRECLAQGGDRARCDPERWMLPEVAICLVEERLVGEGGVDRLRIAYDSELDAVVWLADAGSRRVIVRAQ